MGVGEHLDQPFAEVTVDRACGGECLFVFLDRSIKGCANEDITGAEVAKQRTLRSAGYRRRTPDGGRGFYLVPRQVKAHDRISGAHRPGAVDDVLRSPGGQRIGPTSGHGDVCRVVSWHQHLPVLTSTSCTVCGPLRWVTRPAPAPWRWGKCGANASAGRRRCRRQARIRRSPGAR